jgi:hypothetical protein
LDDGSAIRIEETRRAEGAVLSHVKDRATLRVGHDKRGLYDVFASRLREHSTTVGKVAAKHRRGGSRDKRHQL